MLWLRDIEVNIVSWTSSETWTGMESHDFQYSEPYLHLQFMASLRHSIQDTKKGHLSKDRSATNVTHHLPGNSTVQDNSNYLILEHSIFPRWLMPCSLHTFPWEHQGVNFHASSIQLPMAWSPNMTWTEPQLRKYILSPSWPPRILHSARQVHEFSSLKSTSLEGSSGKMNRKNVEETLHSRIIWDTESDPCVGMATRGRWQQA